MTQILEGVGVTIDRYSCVYRLYELAFEGLTELEMGIDLATWRARVGLTRRSGYAWRPLPVQWRAARWGVGEVMNSTPFLLQGCMMVVCLSLLLGYTFRSLPNRRCGCGKVRRPKLRSGFVPSAEVREMASLGTVGVCLLLRVCSVVLALLLMAGDVETNPGPTGKEGSDQMDKVLPTVDDSPLGEDDQFDILTEMMPVASSWKAIGRGLRIESGRLDMIQETNPGKPRECLSEMLTCWLKRNYNVERFGEPTWRAVVKVVAHPAAGDNCAHALSIAQRHSATVVSAAAPQNTRQGNRDDLCLHNTSDDVFTSEGAVVRPSKRERTERPSFGCGCGNCTFLSYIENGCPHPIPKTTSFPCLDVSGLSYEQQRELRSRLRVESQEIMIKFQQLLSTVYESLCEQKIPVNKLVTHLLSLGAFDPVSKDSQKPLLQTFFQELGSTESIEDVLWVIRDYFSFFNYHVIEHIVNGLGTAQDKVELQNYKKDFHQYSKRRIFECPPIYGPMSDADHAILDLKVDSAFEQFTVEELDNFRYRVSKIFCVSPQSVLRLCQVHKGCLQLTFQVPSFVQQEIFPLSSEQEETLAAEGVIRLTCGDYQFPTKGDENESEPEDTDGVEKRLDTAEDSEEDELSSFGDSEEEETDPRVREEELLMTLRESIKENNVDSFHHHLDELERIVQNNERMKELLEVDGTLCLTAWIGSNPVVETLIEKGVDINTWSRVPECVDELEYWPPLHWAALNGHTDTVQYLTEEGADIDIKDVGGYTPLHRAADNGHTDTVECLIVKGVEFNIKSNDGRTPLHLAAAGGHVDTVKFLVENGANIHSGDDYGFTPLDWAAENGRSEVVAYLEIAADLNILEESESTGRQQEQRQSPEETVPAAPTILAVETTSSTSISVKWAACTNDSGSSITGYVVEYRPALDPASPFETHLLGQDVFSTTLDGLTPSTEYEVRVRGENAVGHSVPSLTMRTKTKVDAIDIAAREKLKVDNDTHSGPQ